jgi:hypothetical protein
MTSNWPVAPLIRIIKGSIHGSPIDGKFAVRAPHGGYGIDTHFLPQGYFGARIDEWEEVTPVPTAALKRLQDAFRGIDVIESLEPPLLEVLSHLPASKPSALDRAVTRVKDIGGRMIDADSTQEERLSLLLDALASVQSAARKATPLTMVARICADWANLENPHSDALAEIKSRAEGNPVRADFIVLSFFIGDIATSLDDGMSDGPRGDLIEMGWYALAWAAQTIEEEEEK